MYATRASTSAAGSLENLFGMGGFLVDLAFAVISVGFTIHSLMSAAESFPPTPSSGLDLPPLPAMAWQIPHFWAVNTSCPRLASCADASVGIANAAAAATAAVARIVFVVSLISMNPPGT